MKTEIGNLIDRYRNLWVKMEDYRSVVSAEGKGKAFIARHHLFSKSEVHDKSWFSEYIDEMYDSSLDCLACYRWYIIPERLRDASGLRKENDLEILLDGAGYSTSLIAEELFSMIDACLESGNCSEEDLNRIRLAYNGLSGFKDIFMCKIVKWGPIRNSGIYDEKKAEDISFNSTACVRNSLRTGIYSNCIRKTENDTSGKFITGAFAV